MAGRNRRGNGAHNGGHMPPPWLSGWFDPELADLFRDEPALYDTAHRLRAARPEAVPDQAYRARLRTSLMAEAEGRIARRRSRFGWLTPTPGRLAWAGAAAGVALIAGTALAVVSSRTNDHNQVVVVSNVSAQHAVSPSDVITVSFNEPMNEPVVVSGLSIRPATQVTTSWQGNKLVISPVHHLAGNTPYTVTISQQDLLTAAGTRAAAPVEITFGTAPTPPPVPGGSTPPALSPQTLGQAASGAQILFAPDGSIVTTSGVPPAGAAAPTSSPSAAPSASASASPSSAPSPAPNVAPSGNAVVEFPAGGGTPRLLSAQPAMAAAFTPSGGTLALAVAGQQGGTDILTSLNDGSDPRLLTHVDGRVISLAWSSNDRVEYATSQSVGAITLGGAGGAPAQVPTGTLKRLSPDGSYAYLAPAAGGQGTLWNIASGATRTLSGAPADVAFSGDSKVVAWVDATQSPRLLMSPVDSDAPQTVTTPSPGAALALLSLNQDGSAVAYDMTPQSGQEQLVVAEAPGGSPTALGNPSASAAFGPGGNAIAMLSGGSVQRAALPGATTTATAVPPAAGSTLNSFVDAQVRGDTTAINALSVPALQAAALTPAGLSRAYIIDVVSKPDATVTAHVQLLVDPTPQHTTPRVANEDVTLGPGQGSGYVVNALNVTPLHDEAAGPHVVHAGSTTVQGKFAVQITFDSDLQAATVAPALAVTSADGNALQVQTSYDPDTRIATLVFPAASGSAYTVTVSTTLRDVDGTPLAAQFSASITAS